MNIDKIKFIDIHSHVIPDVDDGASSIEESVIMIKQAAKQGIETIYATPHLRIGTDINKYCNTVNKSLQKLKKAVLHENIAINIMQGYEVYANQNIIYETNLSKYCMQNTRCILIEVNPNNELAWLVDFAHELQLQDIRIILAHTERYKLLFKEPKLNGMLNDYGVLFQVNTGSLLGQYGQKIYTTTKKLVKNGYVHLIGTDAHYAGHACMNVVKSYKILCRWIGKCATQDIVYNNARNLLYRKE